MKEPLVSVLIPTYNQHNFIEKNIESILNQTYKNLEIIVGDDSENNLTEEIIKKKYPYIKYFHHNPSLGRVKNYKFLLNRAQGEWVLNIDGDDYLIDNRFIEKAIDLIKKNNNISLVFSNYKICKINNKKKISIENPLKDYYIYDGNKIFYDVIFRNIDIPHLCAIYNKKKAMEVGFYEFDITSSDRESLLKICINNKVGFIDTFCGYWVHHGKNISQLINADDILENIKMYDRLYLYAKENNLNVFKLIIWKIIAKLKMIYPYINKRNFKKFFRKNKKYSILGMLISFFKKR